MNEVLGNTAERETGAEKATAWDNLSEMEQAESWEEHCQRAEERKTEAEKWQQEHDKKVREQEFNLIGQSHDAVIWRRENFYHNMAKQEQLEREFNENLTSLEEVEAYAEAGDKHVTKETVAFEGKEIPVYHLKNFPLKFLGHVINYREGDTINTGGAQLSKNLVDNPSLWNETPDYGDTWQMDKATKANTLSTSYVDLSQGYDSFDHLVRGSKNKDYRIIYGFNHVRPTSLLFAQHKDGQIPPRVSQDNRYRDQSLGRLVESVGFINELNADNDQSSIYNEVAMLRYDEKGEPLKPDFMITNLEGITDDTENMPEIDTGYTDETHYNPAHYLNAIKRHAAEHGIPILLVESDYYPDTAQDANRNFDSLLDYDYRGKFDTLLNSENSQELFAAIPKSAHKDKIAVDFITSGDAYDWFSDETKGSKEEKVAKLKEIATLSGNEKVTEEYRDFLMMNGISDDEGI